MVLFKYFIGRLALFFLLFSATIAVPVIEPDDEFNKPFDGLISHFEESDGSFNETALVKRAGGSYTDPIYATFRTGAWPNIAEEDCYIMLCLMSGRRTFRRVLTNGESSRNYRQSGASLMPFQVQNLGRRHTAQINSQTTSAEGFPWESIHWNQPAFVFPASTYEQNRQGGAISGGYRIHGVGFGQWFRITFAGSPYRTYCRALFRTAPDFSVCRTRPKQTIFGTKGVKLANFAFHVVKSAFPYKFKRVGSRKSSTSSKYFGILEATNITDTTNTTAVEDDTIQS